MTAATVKAPNPLVWLGAPMAVSLIACLIFSAPVKVYGLQAPEPVFPLAVAFAWGAIRPSALPAFFLLVMGVVLDCLWGGPLGLWSICLLVVYGPVFALRAMISGSGFLTHWAWYAGTCLGAFFAGFVLTLLKTGVAPSLVSVFWQFLATAVLFPFAWRLIERYEEADVRFR